VKNFANFAWLFLTFGAFAFSVCGQENATNLNDRAVSERDKGDYDKAIADFTQAINLNSNYFEAYAHRSYAKNLKGDYDGAIMDSTKPERFSLKE
jgi:tetratricopeptide (TPR) repeat protein